MVAKTSILKELETIYGKSGNQLYVLYGRTDSEKEQLLKAFLSDKKYFYYRSRQASGQEQRNQMEAEIRQKFSANITKHSYDEFFNRIKKLGDYIEKAEDTIGLLGGVPTYPSTKYGYIVPQKGDAELLHVEGFREKPDEATAEKLVKDMIHDPAVTRYDSMANGDVADWHRAGVASGHFPTISPKLLEAPQRPPEGR